MKILVAGTYDLVITFADLNSSEYTIPLYVIQPENLFKPEKTYNLTRYKTGKLIVNSNSVYLSMDAESVIKNGIVLKGSLAVLEGAGLENTVVTIDPKEAGAIIDFKGVKVLKVVIKGTHVKEIRGGGNIQEIVYEDGASAENIIVK